MQEISTFQTFQFVNTEVKQDECRLSGADMIHLRLPFQVLPRDASRCSHIDRRILLSALSTLELRLRYTLVVLFHESAVIDRAISKIVGLWGKPRYDMRVEMISGFVIPFIACRRPESSLRDVSRKITMHVGVGECSFTAVEAWRGCDKVYG